MALDRTLTLWLTRQSDVGRPDVVSPALDPSVKWVGRTVEHVAEAMRKHLQGSLWEPGVEGVLDQLPTVDVESDAIVSVTLPAKRDGQPRLALDVPVVVISAPTGEPRQPVLAVAPTLGLSWSGTTRDEAVVGLTEAIRLDLLARDPPLDGAAIATIARACARCGPR